MSNEEVMLFLLLLKQQKENSISTEMDGDIDAINSLIEIVKRATPKKPMFKYLGWGKLKFLCCPTCGEPLRRSTVCKKCHQVIY